MGISLFEAVVALGVAATALVFVVSFQFGWRETARAFGRRQSDFPGARARAGAGVRPRRRAAGAVRDLLWKAVAAAHAAFIALGITTVFLMLLSMILFLALSVIL